jgi:hypothetical protein
MVAWAGTNHYVRGKYAADGRWDPGHADRQLGMAPIMLRMMALDPVLTLADIPLPGARDDPAIARATPAIARATPAIARATPAIAPRPPRTGSVAAQPPQMRSRRHARCRCCSTVLASPARRSPSMAATADAPARRCAAFQRAHGLAPDGLAGPPTHAALARAEAGLA